MIELDVGTRLPTKEKRIRFLESIVNAPHMAIDNEKDPVVAQYLGFSFAYGPIGMYFPVGHMEQDANIDDEVFDLARDVMKRSRLPVMQNAGYDLDVLDEHLDVQLTKFACTMVMAHFVDENVLSKKLDYLHKFYTGGEGKIMDPLMKHCINTMGWRYVPTYLMNEYGTQDAVACSELFMILEPLYIEQFGPLYDD